MKPASNRQLTLLRKLNRKKYREKEHLFFAEGERAVEQILNSGAVTVRALFFDGGRQLWTEERWRNGETEQYSVDPQDFLDIADTESPQGILALCETPAEADLAGLSGAGGVLVAADGLQDPGNLGTIIRTAAWFGAAGFLSGKGTVDLFHPKVVRSTAGATGMLPWLNGDLDRVLPGLEEQGWNVWMLDAPGGDSVDLGKAEPSGRDLLVVGNEANGIDPRLLNSVGQRVSIPSPGGSAAVESLNAAVALSIALYRFNL